MKRENINRRIVITGAESTGKSTLALALSIEFGGFLIPELARAYVEGLNRAYTYNDVVTIANQQVQAENNLPKEKKIVFYDTWFVITKIWFKEVYNTIPEWLDQYMLSNKPDLFLVCENDIEWVFDPVRENKDKREYLKMRYIEEIEKLNVPWRLVSDTDEARTINAIKLVKDFLVEKVHS